MLQTLNIQSFSSWLVQANHSSFVNPY